jgi:hypothetical protein
MHNLLINTFPTDIHQKIDNSLLLKIEYKVTKYMEKTIYTIPTWIKPPIKLYRILWNFITLSTHLQQLFYYHVLLLCEICSQSCLYFLYKPNKTLQVFSINLVLRTINLRAIIIANPFNAFIKPTLREKQNFIFTKFREYLYDNLQTILHYLWVGLMQNPSRKNKIRMVLIANFFI